VITRPLANGDPSVHPVARGSASSTPRVGKPSRLSLIRTVKPPKNLSPPLRPRGLVGLVTVLACMALVALPSSALAAGSCPNEQVRSESHSSSLPDCRAYELVSPAYKEGHPIFKTEARRPVSADGSHVLASSLGAFAGTEDIPPGEGFVSGAAYEFSRSPAGWTATPLDPPASQFAEDASQTLLVSGDFTKTTWVLTTPAQFVQQRDLYVRSSGGTFARLGAMTPPNAGNNNDSKPEGASNDLSHVLFSLTETRWPGDTTTLGSGFTPSLYALTAAGTGATEPRLVGVKNTGPLKSNSEAQLIGNCGTELGGAPGGEAFTSGAVSASGVTVVFTTRACVPSPAVNELYARIAESQTVAISEPVLPAGACTGACSTAEHQEGSYQGASEDGSKVFFTTAQPLLNGDLDTTGDLYQAEIGDSGVNKLMQVSRGDLSDPTPGNGAQVLGVAATSSDGTRAYFVAEGILTTKTNGTGEQARQNEPNLYMVEPANGNTIFITTLLPSDNQDWQQRAGTSVVVTPDGRFLVFKSGERLVEYDSQTGALVAIASSGFQPHVTPDGSYVFFESLAALTPRAVSGVMHVYEFHDGQVSLISDGVDVAGQGARLVGVDATGANVFFTTVDALVPQDTDTQSDIYDARIGGGFPAPVSPAGCAGDGCQGPSSIPPALPLANTRAAEGGNLAPPVSTPVVKLLTKAQKLAKGLKACRTKHNKHQRAICEAQARKKYGPTHKAKKANRRVK
jgi:hypothetical protein